MVITNQIWYKNGKKTGFFTVYILFYIGIYRWEQSRLYNM